MPLLKKLLIGVLGILIILIISAGLFLNHIAKKSIPEYQGTVLLENMKQEVTVYRDRFAVPHIIAKNQEDLYRAVGYTMAQDRLWQMDLLRRVTLGRLSEIFGEDLVEVDLLMRSLKFSEKTDIIISKIDPDLLKAVQCFSDGINQFIETHMNKLPPEFTILGYKPEPWKPEYSINLVGYMSWDLTMPYTVEVLLHKIKSKVAENKYLQLLPDVKSQRTPIYSNFNLKISESDLKSDLFDQMSVLQDYGLTVFNGSNNWAVSGKKSVTGKPILANDMHLGLNVPGLWYQMHQTVEGELDVTGVVLPGQPLVICGHNEKIAWGMTNVMVDDMDFYMERLNPDNPDQYEFNGSFKNFKISSETINIKGGKNITKEVRFTHRGPVISNFKRINNQTISMKWIGNEYSNELKSIYLLNRAENWDDFKNAVQYFKAVSQNINYADSEGNIGLYCCAGVPIRKKGDGLSIVPGWTDEYDWKGFVPFEQLPHSYNPESGFVSSANNKIVPDNYPYYISNWFALNYRIDRIREMLMEKEKLSVEDFKKMHADFKSKLTEEFNPLFIEQLSTVSKMTDKEISILDSYKNWDGVLTENSTQAALFETSYIFLVKNLIEDELGSELYKEFSKSSMLHRYLINNIIQTKQSSWADNILTEEKKETLNEIFYKSFKDAIKYLTDKIGGNPDQWQYGKIHKLFLKHPLGKIKILDKLFNFNDIPREIGGSYHTVCPLAYKLSEPFVINHGASQRHIFQTENWDDSLSIMPTGISGIPASDHYCDQTDFYVKNKYHRDLFSIQKIKHHAKYILKIKSK